MQLVQLLYEADTWLTAPLATAELQGPQVPGQALQRDDVDDLLASMGF